MKGTVASANISVWEKTAPQALALVPDNSFPPHMSLVPFKLLPQHWNSEGVSPSNSMLEEELPGTSAAKDIPPNFYLPHVGVELPIPRLYPSY